MTDSLRSIADIVQAKTAHAAECNDMPKPHEVQDKLHQIKESMVKPLDAVKIAQAYLSGQDLYKQFRHDNEMHLIMLLLRDLCCLVVLSGCMEDGFLEDELNNVFNASCLNLNLAEDPKAKSQLLNAVNKIKTFGKSRDEFNKNLGLTQQEVPPPVEAPRKKQQKRHPYKDLKETEQDLIFKAFSDCAPLIPLRKGRRRKRSSGKVVEGLNDEVILEALGEKLQGMHYEFSLLKKQREQSVKLDAAILLKIADLSKEVAEYLESKIWCMDFKKSSCVSF